MNSSKQAETMNMAEIISTMETAIRQLEETKSSGRIRWTTVNEESLRKCRRFLAGLKNSK